MSTGSGFTIKPFGPPPPLNAASREQVERHRKAHEAARQKAKTEGIYIYCPGDPPVVVGLLGLLYGPSGEVAAQPPSGLGEDDFLKLVELANEAIKVRREKERVRS